MPVVLQGIGIAIGLAFVAMILYAAMYIAEELERTDVWQIGRVIKAIVGGLIWAVIGILVTAGLILIAIIVRAVFFSEFFSILVLRFWAVRLGLLVIAFYLLWGIYHGARNRLSQAYRR